MILFDETLHLGLRFLERRDVGDVFGLPECQSTLPGGYADALDHSCWTLSRNSLACRRLTTSVITSYSIHYTKLYERFETGLLRHLEKVFRHRRLVAIAEGERPSLVRCRTRIGKGA